MSKINWKPGTFLYPLPVVMVSCGDMDKSNILTVAWTGIINTDPAMCYISVRKERYSHDIIKKNKEFVINFTTKDLAYVTDFCGVRSGRDVDKFKEMRLTKEKCKFVKCPAIAESPVSVECKVKKIVENGSHDMFISEILSINVDEKYIDKNGKFDITKLNLVAYANGHYMELGKVVGTFGYSVQKKNEKRLRNRELAKRNNNDTKNIKEVKKSIKKIVKTNKKNNTKKVVNKKKKNRK